MSDALLNRVLLHDLATRHAVVEGRLSVADCSRLADLAGPGGGAFSVRFSVGRHTSGHVQVQGAVAGQIDLVCQRCLEPVRHELRSEVRVAVVQQEADLDALPKGYEGFHAAGGVCRLADIAEEEVLLSLPDIPVHAQIQECGELTGRVSDYEQSDSTPVRENPFAVLEQLKTNKE